MTPDEKFPQRERLVKTKDFRTAYKDGACTRQGILVAYVVPTMRTTNRIGFSVSARRIKRAVRRNRVKRLLREAYRTSKNRLKTGHDIVIVVKKDVPREMALAEMRGLFTALLKKAGIIT